MACVMHDEGTVSKTLKSEWGGSEVAIVSGLAKWKSDLLRDASYTGNGVRLRVSSHEH
jgi:hypothetical protein